MKTKWMLTWTIGFVVILLVLCWKGSQIDDRTLELERKVELLSVYADAAQKECQNGHCIEKFNTTNGYIIYQTSRCRGEIIGCAPTLFGDRERSTLNREKAKKWPYLPIYPGGK
jgi:hypothetical protein